MFCLSLNFFLIKFYMTVQTFLVWAVWGSFFLLDRTWEEMIFAAKSKGAYLHSSSWCDQEILCRKKAAEKGGKTYPLLLFSWTSPAPPPEPFQRRPPLFFLNCGCQPRGSYFRGCLSLLMRTQGPWRFRCIFLSLLEPSRPTRDRWISPGQGIPALVASHLLPACLGPPADVWELCVPNRKDIGSVISLLNDSDPASQEGAVTWEPVASGAAAAAALGKTRCTNILDVLSGLLGMYRLAAVALQDSGIWDLSHSQFQWEGG